MEEAAKQGFGSISLPPDHPFCSKFFVNSGLVTLSRFEIVSTRFFPYKYSSGYDGLSYKGVLYSRILVQSKYVINLFNSHMQANYNHEDYDNISSRLHQIVEVRQALDTVMKENAAMYPGSENEMILFCFDANVCVNLNVYPRDKFQKAVDHNPHLSSFMEKSKKSPEDTHFNEYEYMFDLWEKSIDGSPEYHVVDWLKEHYGYRPITYIDSIHNPREIVTPESSEECSLDYIVQLIPRKADQSKQHFSVRVQSVDIAPFLVQGQPYRYLSDHLAVEATLIVNHATERL